MTRQWDAGLYDDKHAFVWKHGAALLEMLGPRAGERVLDLGCGTGHLTAQLAAAGAEMVGIDSSPEMVAQARQSYPDIRFEVADARNFAFAEPFDAVLSNAVLHWVREPEPVVACVAGALKPGGRFVAEFGGRGNVAALLAALAGAARQAGCRPFVSPWYFPALGEYAALLERDGLEVRSAALFDRPTPLEGEHGLRDWVRMFAGDYLVGLPVPNSPAIGAMVKVYLCPSDLAPQGPFPVPDGFGNTVCLAAPAGYAACVGGDESDTTSPTGLGVFYRSSQTRMTDITDGTVNTFLVGERAWSNANGVWAGAIPGGVILRGQSNPCQPVVPGAWYPAATLVQAHTHLNNAFLDPDGSAGMDDFGSRHPGGSNFVFADGSVHFLRSVPRDNPDGSYTPDGLILQALGTRAHGEVVPGDWAY
jgi:trans-aconitate 2-methyltransferase